MTRGFSDFEFEVMEAKALSPDRRGELLGLFQANYRRANPAFLDRSLARLRHVALAYRGDLPVGFALAETRLMDLPRLPGQVVNLAGICCIAPEFRRRGLFGELEGLAAAATKIPETPRRLLCGRVAHPAALRTIGRLPGAVPKPGGVPTAWQREVGAAIARAYGAHDFDPRTFVCIGDGEPIGYPQIEVDVEPEEWQVFEPVDRDRGDSLLALAWIPDSPPGW
jgi:hypothetical protein